MEEVRKREPVEVGQRVGHYRVVQMVGKGGMGSVYEAVHDHIGYRAAIKVLGSYYAENPELVNRFFNEARAVNIIRHPGLVNIFEMGHLDSGNPYIVMEFLDGETLTQRLRRLGGRLDGDAALRLTRQIASTMAAVHLKGIVHRDLKPGNVVIVPDPEAPGGERVKVLDFGVAKVQVEPTTPGEENARTVTGVVIGTPSYMAPEQCRGGEEITDKADVYSLGVMLYRFLSGRLPFTAPGDGALLAKHMLEAPPSLQEVAPEAPPEIVELVAHMLAKDPRERPSMEQVATYLDERSTPLPRPPAPRMPRSRRKAPLPLPLLILGLMLVLGGAFLATWQVLRRPRPTLAQPQPQPPPPPPPQPPLPEPAAAPPQPPKPSVKPPRALTKGAPPPRRGKRGAPKSTGDEPGEKDITNEDIQTVR